MGWFNDQEENVVYAPKVGGEPIIIKLMDLERVSVTDAAKGYKGKNKQDLHYRDEFKLGGGKILPCNAWKLYFAIKESGANPGDSVKISHPGNGEYKVEVVKDGADPANEAVGWGE